MLKKNVIVLFFILFLNPWLFVHANVYNNSGIIYTTKTIFLQQIVHILEIDPKKVNITIGRAQELNQQLSHVSEIAQYHKAIAAINGGFFKTSNNINGIPAGALKINNHWHSITYKPRAAIGWSIEPHTALIDRIQTETNILINNKSFAVHAMNQISKKTTRNILYSASFNNPINILDQQTHLVILNNKIQNINNNNNNIFSNIPELGYVYAINSKLYQQLIAPDLDLKNNAEIKIKVIPQKNTNNNYLWQDMEFIIGGAPLLIYNKQLITDFSVEKIHDDFINTKDSRTAIGILENGNWLFVVLNKNLFLKQDGLTIYELGELMHNLKCKYALNLDGGSSSDFYLADNIQENTYAMRQISNAILVVPKY